MSAAGPGPWRAVVAALDAATLLRSRVSVYLHPLGGRPLLWHVLRALLDAPQPPQSITVLYDEDEALDLGDGFPEATFRGVAAGEARRAVRDALDGPGMVVLVDAAAPLLGATTIGRLLRAAVKGPAAVEALTQPGRALAIAGQGTELAALDDPWSSGSGALVDPASRADALRIADRHALSDASTALRDRLVRRHEAAGVTFLLPATTWVDVDVRIGADTMVYPGCVLEGATTIGAECVIGPHSRVVEASIGPGAELKGWNYVSRVSIRNHAVLEAHERRAAD
jgi:bifunctional N-acetylglucosamine-1-phosphate-uridyltransferase/glucosamine-1-phosphate-acetyltransferase GlmU-like protein